MVTKEWEGQGPASWASGVIHILNDRERQSELVDIGREIRTITVEPAQTPITPQEQPVPTRRTVPRKDQ